MDFMDFKPFLVFRLGYVNTNARNLFMLSFSSIIKTKLF